MDPDDVRRKITPKTRAVMIVHLYGHSCDMEPLVRICSENNLFLVEDWRRFSEPIQGPSRRNICDIATFSFFGDKTITTGEGGMVVARNTEVANWPMI